MFIFIVVIWMIYNINGFGMWEKSLVDDDVFEEFGDDDDGELI